MVKKISFLILAAAILTAGVFAFKKTNYWERSIRIFNYSSDNQFAGREGHGQGGLVERGGPGERPNFTGQERKGGDFGRPGPQQLPDSIRQRFGSERGARETRTANPQDSLRRRFRDNNGERTGRGQFEGGFRDGGGRQGGDFPGGNKIRLTNVQWYLAVFAMFTVMMIYTDKAISLIRKRKVSKNQG